MPWIGAQFCVCMFRLIFKHVPKSKWIPPTTFLWIPRTNTDNANFVGTFVLSRIPQHDNIASSSGFRNCKRIPQMEVDSQIYADSACNLRILFIICVFRLQFADSTYTCGFYLQLRILRKPKFTKHIYHYLFVDCTNCSGFRKLCSCFLKFRCGFRKIACFWGNFKQYSVLAICLWNPTQQRR